HRFNLGSKGEFRNTDYEIKLASKVILRLSALLTGQCSLAAFAHSINLSLSIFGIRAFKVKCEPVSSNLSASIVTSEVASNESGVYPSLPKIKLRDITKHPACAAASNSSGLVPLPSPKRVLKEYWLLSRTLLCVVIFPLPSLIEPFHTAFAVRFIA